MKPFIHAVLMMMLLSFEGCSLLGSGPIADFTIKDVQAARARAVRNLDPAGARCWALIETKLTDGTNEFQIAGIMDAIEAARIVRLKAPSLRQEWTDGCGEVFADVLIELVKRGATRGIL